MSVEVISFMAFGASQVAIPGPATLALLATSTLQATATIAICLLTLQIILHPIWAFGGAQIAPRVAGMAYEIRLMWALASLTVASVLFVLLKGRA